MMRVDNRQEALEMIERHGGPYRVVGGLLMLYASFPEWETDAMPSTH
jgi:hypothetical protein